MGAMERQRFIDALRAAAGANDNIYKESLPVPRVVFNGPVEVVFVGPKKTPDRARGAIAGARRFPPHRQNLLPVPDLRALLDDFPPCRFDRDPASTFRRSTSDHRGSP